MQTFAASFSKPSRGIDPVLQLWLLRMLVRVEASTAWMNDPDWEGEKVVQALGLQERKETRLKGAALRKLLDKKLEDAERTLARWQHKGMLKANIDAIGQLVNLTAVDRKILEFTIFLHHSQALFEAAEKLEPFNRIKVSRTLSCALKLPLQDVRKALSHKGLLARTGLVKLDHYGRSLRDRLELLNSEFLEVMLHERVEPRLLLRGMVNMAPAPELALADYLHLQSSLQLLIPYLRHCLDTKQAGVNILIYGPPGTGKTQLTRVLAQVLNIDLLEVASEDDDGDPCSGDERLRAYRAAQSFFCQSRCMLVFDEIEDVMTESPFSSRRAAAQSSKAWMNRCLESNTAPTLWLSNRIDEMDNAFIRRFDMVVEMPVPPQSRRLQIARQTCGHLLDATALTHLSTSEVLSPAVISRASKVIQAVGNAIDSASKADALVQLMNATLQAQGHRPIARHDPHWLPEVYDPAFIHADTDLQSLLPGLQKSRFARICLYGPPGTGKTAYGRWLSEQLQMPLLVKRASDLMSKWVGDTEKNIAAAFQEAVSEQALLMIDEVDSFLQDRRQAQQGWEVNQVNEMLTQMESFPGIFIASTNLMDCLDLAAMRRFDLKVKFSYLQPAQSWALLQRCCAQMQLPLGAQEQPLLSWMSPLEHLTPGDFATVLRQHRFKPFTSAGDVVQALRTEHQLKTHGQGARIGFL